MEKRISEIEIAIVAQKVLESEGVGAAVRQNFARLIAEKVVELYEGCELYRLEE